MRNILIIPIALLLAACAGAVPWNAQNYSGVTYAKMDCDVVTTPEGQVATDANGHAVRVCDIEVYSGKEQALVKASFNPATGEIDYEARDVKAFQGQAVRAEVEKVISETVGDSVTPDVLQSLIRGILAI